MINHTRLEPNYPYEMGLELTEPMPARLDEFCDVFRSRSTASLSYTNYYTGSAPLYEPDIEGSVSVYHNLVSPGREYLDDWKRKYVLDWTEEDTIAWLWDEVHRLGHSELEVPFLNFRLPGAELQLMKREEFLDRMTAYAPDQLTARRMGDAIYGRLCSRLAEEVPRACYPDRSAAVFRYDSDHYPHQENLLDLDSVDNRSKWERSDSEYLASNPNLLGESSDDAVDEDVVRSSGTASPEYGSDASKSGDESNTKKRFKRPPGRPRGSGRKVDKRPKSVSVPEFIRSLLNDHPEIIRWEDRSKGKFRFVKPDQVARLWGLLKQNENMTFEKFSRAMRYHYKNHVLLPVPDARLVYKFGPKGPSYQPAEGPAPPGPAPPHVKREDAHDLLYS